MLDRLKDRLTYANVTATLALFIALGGTSYAALKLPRNSVGSAQIRTGAVHSSEVRDRSLRLRDIAVSARTALAGRQGPIGPQGPAGAAAAKHFAAVSAAGGLLRGDATSGGRAGSPGTYDVGFADSVTGCAYTATLGTTDTSSAGVGHIAVRDDGGRVGVQTFDAGGNPADMPFQLIVAC
jgi:hypothetical protein